MLPEKTIERLSMYRRVLHSLIEKGSEFIYSYELANLLHLTPVQVRRDIMLMGYTGTQRKGYICLLYTSDAADEEDIVDLG